MKDFNLFQKLFGRHGLGLIILLAFILFILLNR